MLDLTKNLQRKQTANSTPFPISYSAFSHAHANTPSRPPPESLFEVRNWIVVHRSYLGVGHMGSNYAAPNSYLINIKCFSTYKHLTHTIRTVEKVSFRAKAPLSLHFTDRWHHGCAWAFQSQLEFVSLQPKSIQAGKVNAGSEASARQK